jgi:PAS domain S-box-containing protein
MVHADGVIYYANASLAEMFGEASVEELIGKQAIDFATPEEREAVYRRGKHASEGHADVAEEAGFIRVDGSETYLERTTSRVNWNGAAALLVIFRDVNSRRQAREALTASEQRYHGLIENSGLGIHNFKASGGRLFINDALVRLLGYGSLSEINDLPEFSIVALHDRELALQKRVEALENSDSVAQYECDFVCKDESIIPLHVLINPIVWNNEEAVLCTVIELSERKQAEQALRESEERFRHTAEIASDWFWELGSDLRFTWVSSRVATVLPFPVDYYIGKKREEIAPPETDQKQWARHLEDLEARRPFRDYTVTRILPVGAPVHMALSGTPMFNEEGEFTGYRGSGRDITAEVEARRQTAHIEEKFLNAIDNLAEGFALFDADEKNVFSNKWYRRGIENKNSSIPAGMTFEDTVRARIESGIVPADAKGREEEWIAERVRIIRNPAGRSITGTANIGCRSKPRDCPMAAPS